MNRIRDAARSVLPLLATLAVVLPAQAAAGEDACTDCHLGMDESKETQARLFSHWADDIHGQVGLSCADCHGGNPEAFDDEDAAMWNVENFTGAPERTEIPSFCGRCHSDPAYMRRYQPEAATDQEAQYWTSRHGLLLKEGQDKVATCTDCHGVHGIRKTDSPLSPVYPLNVPETCGRCHADAAYMAEFGIPTDQLAKYRSSVHGVALFEKRDTGVATCNDCHGNHGAMPPSVKDISKVCGTCHATNQKLFESSKLGQIFADEELRFCEECHGKHGIQKPSEAMLAWEGDGVCLRCHTDADTGPREVAGAIAASLGKLRSHLEEARAEVQHAEEKGMEVSDLLLFLEEAHDGLVKTRTSVHTFDPAQVTRAAEPGHKAAQEAIEGARALVENWVFKRKYLLVFTVLTLPLVLLTYLKVRQMERS